jgi:hypothetical protein
MTERTRKARRPGSALVAWSSVALFAVLFALVTYQQSASRPAPPRPVVMRKVLKRHIVTTIVPAPGHNSVSSSAASGETSSPAYAEPVTTGVS